MLHRHLIDAEKMCVYGVTTFKFLFIWFMIKTKGIHWTQPIFNEHKRFSCCPERYMKVLCTLSLGHKSTGLKLYEESFEKYLS